MSASRAINYGCEFVVVKNNFKCKLDIIIYRLQILNQGTGNRNSEISVFGK